MSPKVSTQELIDHHRQRVLIWHPSPSWHWFARETYTQVSQEIEMFFVICKLRSFEMPKSRIRSLANG